MGKTENLIPLLILFNLFFILFIVGIIVFIQQYKIKKKEHIMFVNNQNELHKQELLSTQIEIQNQTMQHIGREIHDNIGQKLTLASLYTQQLAYENKAPQINESIESISAIINQSLSELRALSKSLTDDSIDSFSLLELIQSECDKVNDLKKCKVSFKSNEDLYNYSYQIKSVLLRICQEFMQNSIKHANCKNIFIALLKSNDNLSLSLSDDGIGFDVTQKNTGIGILNIKNRTEIIGGKATFESSRKNGTQLTITIPT